VGTSGFAFAMFGRFVASGQIDIPLRAAVALLSGIVIFHPDAAWAIGAGCVAGPAVLVGIWRHHLIAGASEMPAVDTSAADRGDSPDLLSEAKREV
jgi:hypothetical protein